MDDREQLIRERAYRLWEEQGRPDGRAEHHWHKARDMVAMESGHPPEFRPADAAEAPPTVPDAPPGRPGDPDPQAKEAVPPPAGPDIADEGEPVSAIDTVRRTLEVPRSRRGRQAPAGDAEGAMSGHAGRRLRR